MRVKSKVKSGAPVAIRGNLQVVHLTKVWEDPSSIRAAPPSPAPHVGANRDVLAGGDKK